MTRKRVLGAAAAALTLASLLGAATVARPGANRQPVAVESAATEKVAVLSRARLEGHLPDQSARDWVTYADHVVSATVVAETALDKKRAGGDRWQSRRVTLAVDDVLWSADRPRAGLPAQFDVDGWGWRSDGSGGRARQAGEGVPRLEPGHAYVLALAWEEARCSAGDPMSPAQWSALGHDSVVPFDQGVVGTGESAGQVQTALRTRPASGPDDPNFTFEDEMHGRGSEDLRRALRDTAPGVPEQFSRPSPCG